MSEQTRIESLARIFASTADHVTVGIGDDAAVLELREAQRLVVSVDEQIEGTHFRRDLVSLHDIGYRATMAAASDLAAMGATPLGVVAALALPDLDDASLEAVARGQREAADAIGCAIVGGNLARGPVLSIATTVLGVLRAPRATLRSGAHVGDGIYVIGELGLASLGLRALEAGDESEATRAARVAWQRPRARIAEGKIAAAVATAAIDVSDGLAKDLGALCAASDVAGEIDEISLRAHAGLTGADRAAQALHVDVIEAMCGGGEDYALIVTSPEPCAGFHRIGTVGPGPARLTIRRSDGRVEPAVGGFDHFAAPPSPPARK